MYLPEFVWIVYEIGKNNTETLFGVFSSEMKQMLACLEFEDNEYRVEKVRLDP